MTNESLAKVAGVGLYFTSLVALQQVIFIPLVAFLLLVITYRSKRPLFRHHAKYILCIFACISVVMLIINQIFASQEKLFAATVCIGLAALMLIIGAIRLSFGKGTVSTLAERA